MPTKLAAALFGVWMAALGAGFWLEPGWQMPIRLVAGASALLAIRAGVRRFKPARTLPWKLLAATLALSALATTARTELTGTNRIIANAALLAVYPMLALVLVLFARYRTGGGRDRGGLLDALAVTTGITLLTWAFVIAPNLRSTGGAMSDQVLRGRLPDR